MPPPKPPQKPAAASAKPQPQSRRDPLRPVNPLVSRAWLAGGVLAVVFAAAVAGYGALMLLFWQGQWQLLFHPSNRITATPADLGIPFTEIRFDARQTGQSRLDGWWIPAAPNAPFPQLTVLYLHGETGSLSNANADLAALHASGVNVFAFDYRGYGRSEWVRPTEERWRADAEAAVRYLVSTRHFAPEQIILCGSGFGAALAAEVARAWPQIPAEILINPRPPALQVLHADPRTAFFPLAILARDRFDPAHALSLSPQRKLFIFSRADAQTSFASTAAEPKTVLRLTTAPQESPLATPQSQEALRQLFYAAAPSR